LMLIIGAVLGWIFRSDRCSKEKIAVNASWQEQIGAQKNEHDRLVTQNKSLMEQIGQYQASNKDWKLKAKELSDALKEAFERRDELQRNFKEARTQYDVAIAQRDKLLDDIESSNVRGEATAGALKEKDDKIFRLSRELTTWQSRVPPLVERFRERDQDAKKLQAQLEEAHERIAELESDSDGDGTRIEPINAESLPGGLDASNEPHASTMTGLAGLEDQIDTVFKNAQNDPGEDVAQHTGDVADAQDDRLEYTEADVDSAHAADITEEPGRSDDNSGDSIYTDATVQQPMPAGAGVVADIEPPRNAHIGNELGEDGQASSVDAAEPADRDDLKQIKGVGPAIEQTLNDLGIYRFNQIAEMSEFDIDRVAQQLRGFRSRIYREDWIGQARTLQYQKNNDFV
ncbi:MAG: hypothetical protein KJO31_07075, partial [Gammaproteobacteria bacterium]|nr:hypothetical protein [Gammaproteobacteria bacterium]